MIKIKNDLHDRDNYIGASIFIALFTFIVFGFLGAMFGRFESTPSEAQRAKTARNEVYAELYKKEHNVP